MYPEESPFPHRNQVPLVPAAAVDRAARCTQRGSVFIMTHGRSVMAAFYTYYVISRAVDVSVRNIVTTRAELI
jgi:hypothetical protein